MDALVDYAEAVVFRSARKLQRSLQRDIPAWVLLLVMALVAVLMNWKMIAAGVIFDSHDLHYHLTWLQHFSKQVAEGIWYPRWLADTNYGYGSPTFVFYPPLVYYIGSLLKFAGLKADQAIILIFCLALWGAGVGFYLYGRPRWGSVAAWVGAIVFITLPYIGLNLYVRGAVPETWALMAIPLGLWLTERTIDRSAWGGALSLLFALLALTHLPSLILYTIAWGCYTLTLRRRYPWKVVLRLWLAAIWGFALAAFYLIPALVEQPFVSLRHLPDTTGGVAANLLGTPFKDNLRFLQAGIQPVFTYQFIALAGVGLVAALGYRPIRRQRRAILAVLALALLLVVLMTYPSLPVWQAVPVLKVIQHPWRLLGLFSFVLAALCSGAIARLASLSPRRCSLILLAVGLVVLGNVAFTYKLSRSTAGFYNPGDVTTAIAAGTWKGKIFQYIHTALNDPYTSKLLDAKEYRPWVNHDRAPSPDIGVSPVSVMQGMASVQLLQWQSYSRQLAVQVQQTAILHLRTYYYPAWRVWVNGQPHPLQMAASGAIALVLEPGNYQVKMQYQATPALQLGWVVSGFSLVGLGWVQYRAYTRRQRALIPIV